jgi:hypothetical protein
MLTIRCHGCGAVFDVEGYTTPDTWFEPGEVVTELRCHTALCICLRNGENYEVLSESHQTFDDDVL